MAGRVGETAICGLGLSGVSPIDVVQATAFVDAVQF